MSITHNEYMGLKSAINLLSKISTQHRIKLADDYKAQQRESEAKEADEAQKKEEEAIKKRNLPRTRPTMRSPLLPTGGATNLRECFGVHRPRTRQVSRPTTQDHLVTTWYRLARRVLLVLQALAWRRCKKRIRR